MKQKQKGQAILEFAVILPLFVFISFGLIDIQWSIERAADLDYIVTEVARCEAIKGDACTGANNPTLYATQLATNVGMHVQDLTVVSAQCNFTSCTTVMTYNYKALGVWFPKMIIQRTGTAALPGGAS
jgi:Flp pilus assembly protein TadG